MNQKLLHVSLTAVLLSVLLLPLLPSAALADALADCQANAQTNNGTCHTNCLSDFPIIGSPDQVACYDDCDSNEAADLAICDQNAANDAAAPATTTAAPTSVTAATALENPLPSNDLRTDIGVVISGVLGLTGVAALAMFVWGGVQWLISGGNPDMVKKGKSTVTWAAIGLVVIFTSYALVSTLITALAGGTS